MTVAEIPDFVRAAMEKAGVDIGKVEDELEAAAVEIAAPDVPDQLVLPPVLPVPDAPEGHPDTQTTLASGPEQTGLPSPDGQAIGAFHGGGAGAPETERLAAISQWPTAKIDRRRVLDWIAAQRDNGSTDEEIGQALGMIGNTVRPRRGELVDDGWVEDSGRRRPTQTGRSAAVWVLTEQGRAEWKPGPATYEREE